MPLSWDEFLRCYPADYTLRTVPARLAERGDAHAQIDASPGSLEALLAVADRHEATQAPPPKFPVITIANAKHKADALAGLERWKERHPHVAAKLAPEDVLVDTNRGRATAWYRVRVNLKHVPADEHPPVEPQDPDYDPRSEYAKEE